MKPWVKNRDFTGADKNVLKRGNRLIFSLPFQDGQTFFESTSI